MNIKYTYNDYPSNALDAVCEKSVDTNNMVFGLPELNLTWDNTMGTHERYLHIAPRVNISNSSGFFKLSNYLTTPVTITSILNLDSTNDIYFASYNNHAILKSKYNYSTFNNLVLYYNNTTAYAPVGFTRVGQYADSNGTTWAVYANTDTTNISLPVVTSYESFVLGGTGNLTETLPPTYIKFNNDDIFYVYRRKNVNTINDSISNVTYEIDYLKTWYNTIYLAKPFTVNCVKSTNSAIWDKYVNDPSLPVSTYFYITSGNLVYENTRTGSIILIMATSDMRNFDTQTPYTVYRLTMEQFGLLQKILYNTDYSKVFMSNIVNCYYLPENMCIDGLIALTVQGIYYLDNTGTLNNVAVDGVEILRSETEVGDEHLNAYYLDLMTYTCIDYRDIVSTRITLDIPYLGTVDYPNKYLKDGDNDITAIYRLDIINGVLTVSLGEISNIISSVNCPKLEIVSSDYEYTVRSTILQNIPSTLNSVIQGVNGNLLPAVSQITNIANTLYTAENQPLSAYPSSGDFYYIGKKYYRYSIISPKYQYSDSEWWGLHGYPVQKFMKLNDMVTNYKYWFDTRDMQINFINFTCETYVKNMLENGVVL